MQEKFGSAPAIHAEINHPDFDEENWEGDPELVAKLKKNKKINSAHLKL